MSRFHVMCKVKRHSIQSCLTYISAKSQGWTNAKTKVINKFQRLLKMGNDFVYSLSITSLCAHDTLQRLFAGLVKTRYKTMHLRRTSSLQFLVFKLLRWGGSLYRRILFSVLCIGLDSELFAVNLIKLENVLVCCITQNVLYWRNRHKIQLM